MSVNANTAAAAAAGGEMEGNNNNNLQEQSSVTSAASSSGTGFKRAGGRFGNTKQQQQQQQQQQQGGDGKTAAEKYRTQEVEPAFVLYPGRRIESLGSEKEIAEEAMPKMERVPSTVHYTMRRDFFLRRRTLFNFLNRDAADDGATYLRPTKGGQGAEGEDAWLLRMESEASVQASRPKVDKSTQVARFRKVDFSIQVQPDIVDACGNSAANNNNQHMGAAAKHLAFTAAAGGGEGEEGAEGGDSSAEKTAEEIEKSKKKMKGFFEKVMPRMLHHLTQSAAVPLFQDDFTLLMDEDNSAVVSNREESDLIEAGNYTHNYTRDRYISSIDWKPGPKQILAISSIKAVPLEHRIKNALDVEPSVSIIWSLQEQMNPQMLLESPCEVFSIKFHPKPLSQIVLGGLSNGQICMWDLSRAPADLKNLKKGGGGGSGGVGGGGGGGHGGAHANQAEAMSRQHLTMEQEVGDIPSLPQPIRGHTTEIATDEHVVSRLQPSMISRVENSHRRAVHDICWLPDGLECGFDGRATVTDQCFQFATISEDGAVFIWDLRPENLPQDRLRKLKHQGRSAGDEQAKVWVPMLKYQLPRSEGPGDLLGLRLHIEGLKPVLSSSSSSSSQPMTQQQLLNMQKNEKEQLQQQQQSQQQNQQPQHVPSYTFMATTIEGEVTVGNWGPKPGSEEGSKSMTGYDASGGMGSSSSHGHHAAKVLRYVSTAHAGPVWGLHRHPQLHDVFLTVGDWGFKVWRVGVEAPIMSSPMGDQQTTCGRWSSTRPGLVFIGTRDGFVQIWDLLDRSHKWVVNHPVIKEAITCIEFRPNPHQQHHHHSSSGHHQGGGGGAGGGGAGKKKRVTQQIIALGTKNGAFHFFELPRALVRGPSAELKTARSLFERETRRVSYYSWRWEERRKESELRAAAISVSEAEAAEEEKRKQEQEAIEAEKKKKHDTKSSSSSSSSSSKKKHHKQQQQQQKDDDLLGGKEEEGAGDFTFTAEDDDQYLNLVKELASKDSRMAAMTQQEKEEEEEE